MPARTRSAPLTSTQRWTLAAAVLGSGIVFLDSTVVNVALPRIGKELHSSLFGTLEAQTYVYSGYLLTLSALLILAGALSDYYGRRRMFTVGLIGFGATSLLCGLAWNMEALILFRVLQGASGALLVPGSLALITAAFDGEQQGRAFGIWAGASAATTTLGPFVAGLLVDSLSWRVAFLINVPLVVVALVATATHVEESKDEEATGHFDWLGAVAVALAVGGLAFGTIRGQQHDWHDAPAFGALGVGGLATVALPILMLKRRNPLIPPHLFRSRNFTVTNLSTLVIYGALYVLFLFVVLFVQGTLGYDAAAAGLIGLPTGILLALFSSRFGKLAAKRGPRLFMSIGPALMGLAVLWLVRLPPSSQAWRFGTQAGKRILPPTSYFTDLFPMYMLFATGLVIMVAPLTTALMQSVPKHNSGVASAINNAISRVGPQLAGAAIFVAIASSFYAGIGAKVPGVDTGSSQFRKAVPPLNQPDLSKLPPDQRDPRIPRAAREASTHSFHVAMVIAAGLLFAGALVNAVGIRNPKKVGIRPGMPGGEAPRVLHHSPRGPAHVALVPPATEGGSAPP